MSRSLLTDALGLVFLIAIVCEIAFSLGWPL